MNCNSINVLDTVITKYGAGRILRGGLKAIVQEVNGPSLLISINGNFYHVQQHEVLKVNA